MSDTIADTIGDLTYAKDQLIRALDNIPDDRINWSPAPTARTPIQIAAHSGFSLGYIADMFQGHPYPAPTMAQADEEFLALEKAFTTREETVAHIEANFQKHVDILNSIKPEDLERSTTLPFGMGAAPLGAIIGVGALHTRTHTAQIEYIQTILGDRTW